MTETPDGPTPSEIDLKQRGPLLLFYLSVVAFLAIEVAATWLFSSPQAVFGVLAPATGAVAIGSLYRLLSLSDERQKQINYQALQFGFLATLALSLLGGIVRGFSVAVVSWGGVVALLLVVWSIGLIFCSWRYR